MTPKNMYKVTSDVVKLARKNPRLTRMPPRYAQIFGPLRSCSRPAAMKVAAKHTTAIVYTHDVSVRVQPNSFSRGKTKTLQAYSEPSARFIKMPPTTGSHRLVVMGRIIYKSEAWG